MLDYQYYKDRYQLIAADLTKQKEVDVDSRAIQQIELYGVLKTNSQVCAVLKKMKRNDARILQRNSKSSVNNINV